jgi:hypothetical protein
MLATLSRVKAACSCAVADGLPRRALLAALVVGTALNLINQGDALFGPASLDWLKLGLTYVVPYSVTTYGAVSERLRAIAPPSTRSAGAKTQ